MILSPRTEFESRLIAVNDSQPERSRELQFKTPYAPARSCSELRASSYLPHTVDTLGVNARLTAAAPVARPLPGNATASGIPSKTTMLANASPERALVNNVLSYYWLSRCRNRYSELRAGMESNGYPHAAIPRAS